MSTIIDETQVRHIAQLARLKLSDEEARLFAGQLAKILEYPALRSAATNSSGRPPCRP